MMESIRFSGLTVAAAGGIALLAAIGLTKLCTSVPSQKEPMQVSDSEDQKGEQAASSASSTRPPSASPSPTASPGKKPPVASTDSLFFSILDSYNAKTPGLSSGTPSPSGRKKRRNRNSRKKNS